MDDIVLFYLHLLNPIEDVEICKSPPLQIASPEVVLMRYLRLVHEVQSLDVHASPYR